MSSIRTLAGSLGLSITTVSRALDGYSDVAAATRERVRKAADEVGYRPNATARRLRRGTGETVAFVMPTEPGRFYEPVFAEQLAAIGEHLSQHHHDLVLLAARPGADEAALYRRLVEGRRADAFIVVRTRRDDERVHYLQQMGVPFICHGRTDSAAPYAYIDGDGEAGFHALTARLIARGHRRIALLSAPTTLMFATRRAAGWRKAMAEAGLLATLMAEGPHTEEGGHTLASRFLALAERPTVMICATDRMAVGAMRAIENAGLKVGHDIAVTGHDNIPASLYTDPPLTTMELPMREVGQRLAEMVMMRLGGADIRDLQEVRPLVQHPRASSGEGA
ncbi:MAG TPA: substrate-binding domain-containing protein [Dongiaceae bacterium]|jgi:LacI family transcriptional regulator|nr:substrate-binding domain-containing protein [Dongiaceae bacterium]